MPADPCPSRQELIALGAGLVADGDASRIGEHLDLCVTCCAAMETVLEQDALAIALRRNIPALPDIGGSSITSLAIEPIDERSARRSISQVATGSRTEISANRFSQLLSDCGIISAAEVSAFLASLPSDQQTLSGADLAQKLVQAGKLTTYQADTVLAGKGKSLIQGNYIVLAKLGQGGMGVVYKAIHQHVNRVVALKVLAPRFSARPEFAQRFQREVQAAAKLSHPNIVKALDAELAGSKRFLVMEYVVGVDLASIVRRRGKLPLRSAIDATIQAARGLEFAHGQGIVHRDVKPSNLMREPTGTIRLLDLGLARMISAESSLSDLTTTGTVMGTADYMAPEQAADTKHADERADIYSLGITMWYLVTGRVAYEGGSAMSKLLAHRETPVPSLAAARKEVPPELDRIFQKMAAKSPEQRYASMAALISELESCLQQVPATSEDSQFFATLPGAEDQFSDAQMHVSTLSTRFVNENDDTHPEGIPVDFPIDRGGLVPSPVRTQSRKWRWSIAISLAVAVTAIVVWQAQPGARNSSAIKNTNRVTSIASNSVGGTSAHANAPAKTVTASPVGVATAAAEKQNGQSFTQPVTPPQAPTENATTARRRLVELNRVIELDPDNLGALVERSGWHKRLAMWREATADVERMANLASESEKSIVRMQVSYISLLAGDVEAYHRTCQFLLDHFSDSDKVEDLERVCKAPLFLVGAYDPSTLPIRQFEALITDGPDKGPMHWACITRAFVACHQNEPAAALEWLGKREPPPAAYHLYTFAKFVRAQALHKLGRREEARTVFDEAVSLMPDDLLQRLEGKMDSETLLSNESTHGDWLILWTIYRQTQTLLDAP